MSSQHRDDEDELGIIPNRIKALRRERDMTLEQLAEKTGLSVGHISNVENHKKGFTAQSLRKIASALGVKPGELLDTSNAWQEVTVMGIIGQNGIFRPAAENGMTKPKKIRVPLALGDTVAFLVEGQSLYPRYDDGSAIICVKAPVADPATCIGRECFLVLANGVSLIRRLERGSQPDTYTLTSHNQPPMLDQEVLNCRPVIVALPPLG